MNNKISDKDKKDWQNFISNNEKVYNKDLVSKKNNLKKVKTIDLHGYTLDKANKKISDFINECYSAGIYKLIVITGKGSHSHNEKDPYVSRKLSILKYSVPDYITKNIDLMKIIHDIKDAEINDGGSGVFYIFLKKNKNHLK